MGLDLLMVPVRLESPAMRAVRENAELWELAAWRPPFFEDDDDDGPLPRISREILEDVPAGFDAVHPFPDRSQEQAEYLLGPLAHRAFGSWEERERSLPYRTIHGDDPFARHAESGQGHPWRCSTSRFLAEAASRIDAIDPGTLRRQFSVDEMAGSGVYKARRGVDDDEVFGRLVDGLRTLAHEYHRLAASGLGLVVILY